MAKSAWTRNQKLLLIGVLIAILTAIGNWVYSYNQLEAMKSQQIIIKSDYDEIHAKLAFVKNIKADSMNISNNASIGGCDIVWNGSALCMCGC